MRQLPCAALIEHPVMIVALSKAELLIGGIDPRSDHGRCAKIERRAGDRHDRSRGDQR